MYFVPQFTEATVYRYNNPRKCDISNDIMRIYNKFIASSSNNIFYIQIHHFIEQTMLNQTLYYSIRSLAVLFFFQHVQSFLLSNAKVRLLRTSADSKTIIVSSSNNIFYIHITILLRKQCRINGYITRYNVLNQTQILRG